MTLGVICQFWVNDRNVAARVSAWSVRKIKAGATASRRRLRGGDSETNSLLLCANSANLLAGPGRFVRLPAC